MPLLVSNAIVVVITVWRVSFEARLCSVAIVHHAGHVLSEVVLIILVEGVDSVGPKHGREAHLVGGVRRQVRVDGRRLVKGKLGSVGVVVDGVQPVE